MFKNFDWKSLAWTLVTFIVCLYIYKLALPYLQRVPVLGALLPVV